MDCAADEINNRILNKFKALRLEKNLTLEEVARRSGVDRSYIGLLEKGKSRPTLEVAIRISHALGSPLWKLLQDAGDKIPTD
jgi:transcriptional regulator with XRE-family HTH domain